MTDRTRESVDVHRLIVPFNKSGQCLLHVQAYKFNIYVMECHRDKLMIDISK